MAVRFRKSVRMARGGRLNLAKTPHLGGFSSTRASAPDARKPGPSSRASFFLSSRLQLRAMPKRRTSQTLLRSAMPQQIKRTQVFFVEAYPLRAFASRPEIARQAAAQALTPIVDLNERLPAVLAFSGLNHRLSAASSSVKAPHSADRVPSWNHIDAMTKC
jgi:hypothetical protein